MIDPDARERAVLELLDRWPWNLGGVIIGGYAVLAYGPPRYSDDLDIVIPKSAAKEIRPWLSGEGFKLVHHHVPNPQNFAGQVERYELDKVSLDLLADSVRDREAQVDVPESWIAERARRSKLISISGRTNSEVPIARPEAIWALKLLAGRARDLSDLFAISDAPFDRTEVEAEFRRLAAEPMIAKLQAVRAKLGTRKLYVDSLSRRALGTPNDPANTRRWALFTSTVDRIVSALEGSV